MGVPRLRGLRVSSTCGRALRSMSCLRSLNLPKIHGGDLELSKKRSHEALVVIKDQSSGLATRNTLEQTSQKTFEFRDASES
jgi:hypothetical protein